MDLKTPRYWFAQLKGSDESLKLHCSAIEFMPKLTLWLHSQRNADFTIRSSRSPIEASDQTDSERFGIAPAPEVPERDSADDWQSYYLKLVTHFDGAEDMAKYLANEEFGAPQLPWLGDDMAARFVHMNASARLYQKADPDEYVRLNNYVATRYPSLYAGLTLQR